ncbi:hypothetical protein JOD20_004950 [Herpetosiphon giganteus]|nr:hypothetical protein [Herpetosiphon giganteus]
MTGVGEHPHGQVEAPNGDTELTTIALLRGVCCRRLTHQQGLKPAALRLHWCSTRRHQPPAIVQPPCGAAGAAAAPRHRGKSHRPGAAYLTSLRERLRRFCERCDTRLNARWTHGCAAPSGNPSAWFATLLGVRRGGAPHPISHGGAATCASTLNSLSHHPVCAIPIVRAINQAHSALPRLPPSLPHGRSGHANAPARQRCPTILFVKQPIQPQKANQNQGPCEGF